VTSFFISPFEPPDEWYGQSNLEVDPIDLMERLRYQWLSLDATMDPGIPHHLLDWEAITSAGFIRGTLQTNKQIVVLDGSTRELAEFVIWYRGLISSEYRLFFFHESLYTCMEIKPATSLDELVVAIEEGTK